ncbi:MAG: DsrE/DsrF/DrsH-like family protein [Candidatus Thermoplasmatota archaeon]|jgi:peroxiredoxin family protein|nr:DsrE/DsrF/DrsH-like family protein [Candidatus Thermoplasmatota archaeon]
MTGKVSLILFSGNVDRLMAGSIITSGAVANDMDVNVFVTFWALLHLKKTGAPAPTLSPEAGAMAERMMKIMSEKKMPSWLDTIKQAAEVGNVTVYACAMFADMMGIRKSDLDPIVRDVIGVSQFVDMSRDSNMTLFI